MLLFALLLATIPLTQEMSLEGEPLYGPQDKIHLLNVTNFQSTVCGSDRGWLVEFYSSWCGHCIHFAPTFKQFAAEVTGWKDIVTVAAIDCAADVNMPTCREYEVMGYPTLKYFTPNTVAGDTGLEMGRRDRSVNGMRADLVKWVEGLQVKSPEKVARHWPDIRAYRMGDLSSLWTHNTSLRYTLLLIEDSEEATVAQEVILDEYDSVRKLGLPLQLVRMVEGGAEVAAILAQLKSPKLPAIMAINRDLTMLEAVPVKDYSREGWRSAVKAFIWARSKELSPGQSGGVVQEAADNTNRTEAANQSKGEKVASRKDLMNRRYKVFISDLEKTIIYAVSHEVAQHVTIAGETLAALQKFVTVLEKYFPARPEMEVFIKDLHAYVHGHEDVIKGEALSTWMSAYVGQHGVQANPAWLGCKGSKSQYGGYPCGLWTLWHTLTVSQARASTGEPQEVLLAMQGFVEEFFGCRECARHFDQTIDHGKGIAENVETHRDAVLYLWRVHNKVNTRLQGDISEDPVFPKEVFPVKEFCSRCHAPFKAGTNMWDEFNHDEVFSFLQDLYSSHKLSNQGLLTDQVKVPVVEGGKPGRNKAVNALALVEHFQADEQLDLKNYKEAENQEGGGAARLLLLFNWADISFGLLLWVVSALLLIFVYLKFFMNRRFSNSFLFGRLKRKSSLNPLLGKV